MTLYVFSENSFGDIERECCPSSLEEAKRIVEEMRAKPTYKEWAIFEVIEDFS